MAYNQELAHRVWSLLSHTAGTEEKKMFGGVGYLLRGNMVCGVHGDYLIVRLSASEGQSALAQPHVGVFDLTGRPMKGWITIAPAGLESDVELKGWVERGLNFGQSLPAK